MPQPFTLGKNERLKSRKLIEQLFSEGKKFSVTPFRVFYVVEQNNESGLQVGVGTSTKNFKRAVDRNRIKRLMREGWRLQKNELQEELKMQKQRLLVFIIYTGRDLPDYREILSKTAIVLQKLKTLTVTKE